MKVLVACEYSRTVSEAFERLGHDVTSCDILPAEKPGKHYQGNVFDILYKEKWDLLIAHPPCTYLTYACTSLWDDEQRTIKRIEAADFFMKLYTANIPHICVENPRGIMYKIFRQPDQEIHPYYFGDREMKRTGLWLKNLPKLQYQIEPDLFNQNISATQKPEPYQIQIRKKTGQIKKRYMCDATNRDTFKNGHLRSKFFRGIANAMAEQWTNYIKENHLPSF